MSDRHFYVFHPLRFTGAVGAQAAFDVFFDRLIAAEQGDVSDASYTTDGARMWLDFWVRADSAEEAMAKTWELVRSACGDLCHGLWQFEHARAVEDTGDARDACLV